MSELYVFLLFILTGISIGILFDIFRILRKSFKTIDFITYIQDFLFWILAGIILLYSIFSFNNGELRGYIFIGVILGVALYMLIFSKYFVKIAVTIISIIKKIIYTPIKLIINFIVKFIVKPVSKLALKIRKAISAYITKYKLKDKINLNLLKINSKKKKNDKLSNKIE